ncbi:hypothetical protein [Chitinophaga silvatica]|nr:hypothetical protein [Chitinophaga silvatica]
MNHVIITLEQMGCKNAFQPPIGVHIVSRAHKLHHKSLGSLRYK